MTEKEIQRWEKIRAGGKTRYLWLNGVLVWGFGAGALFLLVISPLLGVVLNGNLLLKFLLWLVAGYFFGVVTWTIQERNYASTIRTRSAASGQDRARSQLQQKKALRIALLTGCVTVPVVLGMYYLPMSHPAWWFLPIIGATAMVAEVIALLRMRR